MCSEMLTAICKFLNACYTIYYSPLITVFLPRDRLISLSYFFLICDLGAREVRREVRTCTSCCDPPHSLYLLHLVRNLHIIYKDKKNKKKPTVDRVITGKTL